MANNNQQSREYKVLAHISAVPNGDKCGYSAYISLSPLKRKILSGRVSKGDAPAFAVYGELIAVRETVEFLAEAGINSATIKLNREKAIDALTGNAAVAGCETLAKEILGIIGDRDYVFSTEPESKTGTTYIMAKRALGQFDYKGGYKWRPECDGNVTDIVRFTVQEFYTRKTHEKWEYANLGYMCNSLNWGKATIGLPISAKKTIDLYFKDPLKQNIAARMYYCGLTPKDACKCALEVIGNDGREKMRHTVKTLAKQRDNENRSGHLNEQDLENVVDRIMNGYYNGEYPLRTLLEAVTDVYLDVYCEKTELRRPVTQGRVYIAGPDKRTKIEHCDCCGGKITEGFRCADKDIANILMRKGGHNRFCSVECFAKAAGLARIAEKQTQETA